MRWAEKQRHTFMCDHLAKEGWLGRKPIMDKFGISKPQAAADIRKLREAFPLLLKYDTSAKRYVIADLPILETAMAFVQPTEKHLLCAEGWAMERNRADKLQAAVAKARDSLGYRKVEEITEWFDFFFPPEMSPNVTKETGK